MKNNKKGEMTQSQLVTTIIAIVTLAVVIVIYLGLKDKGVNYITFIKNIIHSIGLG